MSYDGFNDPWSGEIILRLVSHVSHTSIADDTTVLCKHNAIHEYGRRYPSQPFWSLHRESDRKCQKIPRPEVDFGVIAIKFEDSRDVQNIKRIGCTGGESGMLVSRLGSDIPIATMISDRETVQSKTPSR